MILNLTLLEVILIRIFLREKTEIELYLWYWYDSKRNYLSTHINFAIFFFGRANITVADKYLLAASIERDDKYFSFYTSYRWSKFPYGILLHVEWMKKDFWRPEVLML